MARFENEHIGCIEFILDVKDVFCPLGQKNYTLRGTIYIEPCNTIPDYIEVDEWLNTHIANNSWSIEDAIVEIQRYIFEEYKPYSCDVEANITDAAHSKVNVYTKTLRKYD